MRFKKVFEVRGLIILSGLSIFPFLTCHGVEENNHHETHFSSPSQEQVKQVDQKTKRFEKGNQNQTILAQAQLEIDPDRVAHICPKTSGIVVLARKNLGENVVSDELLANLVSREITESKGEYLKSLKRLQLAESTYNTEKVLHEKKISSDREFIAAENEWQQALLDRDLNAQKLCALGMNHEQLAQLEHASHDEMCVYEIRSPIAGKILSRHISKGEYVDSNHEVYVVADLSTIWAKISISAKDRMLLRTGQTVKVTSNQGQSTLTKLTYLSPIIEEGTQTSTGIALIDNSAENWFPGSSAQVEIILE